MGQHMCSATKSLNHVFFYLAVNKLLTDKIQNISYKTVEHLVIP